MSSIVMDVYAGEWSGRGCGVADSTRKYLCYIRSDDDLPFWRGCKDGTLLVIR
jgi:hypothetical protein